MWETRSISKGNKEKRYNLPVQQTGRPARLSELRGLVVLSVADFRVGSRRREMSECPPCNAEVGLSVWLKSRWHHLVRPACCAHLTPSRLASALTALLGPCLAIAFGVPLLNSGYPLLATAFFILVPSCAVWFLTDHARLYLIKKHKPGSEPQPKDRQGSSESPPGESSEEPSS